MGIPSDEPTGRAPGWYKDPANPGTLRHWDGRAWAPPHEVVPSSSPPPSAASPGSGGAVWAVLGILAVLVLLLLAGCVAMLGIAGGMMNQGL